MTLNNLPKTTVKKKKRLGRGYGSTKGGHTVGRGAKGDKARGSSGLLFAGTKSKKSWLKRLPLWRGKGRHQPVTASPISLFLSQIENQFKAGETVSLDSLVKKGIISSRQRSRGVKLLAKGQIKQKLVVSVPCSGKLNRQITKLGGKLDNEVGSKA
ncbi:MAG: uL15 family ribosomal protein [Patescibacteria group bacterium]